MVQSRKLFTAEMQLQKRMVELASPTAGLPPEPGVGVSGAVAASPATSPPPGPAAAGGGAINLVSLAYRLDHIERKLDQALKVDQEAIDRIHVELADISGRIKATKAEIAALRHPLAADDKFIQASEQLTSVISATEDATNRIMSSTEALEEILQELRGQTPPGYMLTRMNEMSGLLVRIFEACNFQDLTGQRITKVVRTLSFIEQRINAMMDLWSRDELGTMPLPPSIAPMDGDLELHGPNDQPHEDPVSQADIDALFN